MYSKHRKGSEGRRSLRQHPLKAEVPQAVPEYEQGLWHILTVPSYERLCGVGGGTTRHIKKLHIEREVSGGYLVDILS